MKKITNQDIKLHIISNMFYSMEGQTKKLEQMAKNLKKIGIISSRT